MVALYLEPGLRVGVICEGLCICRLLSQLGSLALSLLTCHTSSSLLGGGGSMHVLGEYTVGVQEVLL